MSRPPKRDVEGGGYLPSSEELVSILIERESNRCIGRSAKGRKEGKDAERSKGTHLDDLMSTTVIEVARIER